MLAVVVFNDEPAREDSCDESRNRYSLAFVFHCKCPFRMWSSSMTPAAAVAASTSAAHATAVAAAATHAAAAHAAASAKTAAHARSAHWNAAEMATDPAADRATQMAAERPA
jgi:hypothetical protein